MYRRGALGLGERRWEEGKHCQAPANGRYMTGLPKVRLIIDREFGPPLSTYLSRPQRPCCKSALKLTLFNPTFTSRVTGGWSGRCWLLLADGIVVSAATSAAFQTFFLATYMPVHESTLKCAIDANPWEDWSQCSRVPRRANLVRWTTMTQLKHPWTVQWDALFPLAEVYGLQSYTIRSGLNIGMPHAAHEVARTTLSTPRALAADVPAVKFFVHSGEGMSGRTPAGEGAWRSYFLTFSADVADAMFIVYCVIYGLVSKHAITAGYFEAVQDGIKPQSRNAQVPAGRPMQGGCGREHSLTR
ncbi:hypothetical protein DFH06DRAFT_1131389 [Mycena polygramma]|nr:hypothetical protein DFH06DRAFT_1131389 [Mycena polygramma]